MKARAWPSKTVSPRVTAIARTTPLTRAWITCSIFIASMTSTSSPARTRLPFPHRHADDRALHGGRDRNRVLGRLLLCRALAGVRRLRGVCRHVVRRAGRALPQGKDRERVVRIDPGAEPARRDRRLEEQAPVGRRVRPEQLAHVLLDEAGVKPTGQELRMTQEALEERGIGRHARDLELAERAVRLGGDGHQRVRGRGDDQLGEQRIEPRAGPVARISERVDADARPRRQLEHRERPARRARGPVGRHRLHVDPHLHRHPARAGHLALTQPERGQRPPRGQLELQTDEVEPGHLLRHRVLHLQARIGLDEGEGRVLAAVGVDEEFHRGQIVEARRARERHGGLEDPLPHPHAEPGRRRNLDQLLTLALNAALALPEVGDAAGAIAGDLDLDVAGAREEPLRVHLAIAERLQRLRPAPRVGRLEIIGAAARVASRARPRRQWPSA